MKEIAVTTKRPRPVDGEDPLETRVHDLELEMGQLREECRSLQEQLRMAAKAVERALKESRFARDRLAQFYPERHYCPHCRAVVHREATACKACGRSWGTPVDPKVGLPRE
jgi:hypothetical protein